MKIYKVIIGILLFAVPISLHRDGNYTFMSAPIGVLTIENGDIAFCLHNGLWYTEDGRLEFFLNSERMIERETGFYMFDNESYYYGYGLYLSLQGIMTTIILYGLALYVILAIIDHKYINLLSNLLMLGFFTISLVAFCSFRKEWYMFFDYGIPVFSIISGILAIVGLVFSGLELSKKKF
ncbi:MAG: hypothetical protein ACFFDS_02145 [Candidatus Thorarchaeota archaeon]